MHPPGDQADLDVTLATVLVGSAAVLAVDPRRGEVISGIDKRSLDRPVRVGPHGLEGDQQGDRKHHGGGDKAVHHYAFEHYPFWRAQLGDLPLLARPGAFGENLSTTGITEDDLRIGDVLRAGTALLQVSQGRQPCWKLDLRFGVRGMARRVQRSVRTGWYYRVLEPGFVAPGDRLTLVDRTTDWPIGRALRVIFRDHPAGVTAEVVRDRTAELAALPALSDSWRDTLKARLDGRDSPGSGTRLDG